MYLNFKITEKRMFLNSFKVEKYSKELVMGQDYNCRKDNCNYNPLNIFARWRLV